MDSKTQYDEMLREKPTDFLSEAPDHFLLNKKDLFLIGAHPFSEATRRRMIKEGKFPTGFLLSANLRLWRLGEIREWLKTLQGE